MTNATMTPDDSDGPQAVVMGPTFIGFREEVVRAEARASVQASTLRVLEGALDRGPGATGLVVGRVQSGKTLSYEGVIALARDNDFAVVIVVSGISNPLLAQGERRLRQDLGKAAADGWLFLAPADESQPADHVERELERIRDNWMNSSTPAAYKQTAVLVLLKNYTRIRDLAATFRRLDLGTLRVLLVDDEADQASLNTQAGRNRESATYANLRALRDSIPNHYYLQYTATPQAPLLIAIQDALSPDYVRVLEPGSGYTGGETYFGTPNELVQAIDAADVLAADTPAGPPPDSLRRAMQEFLIGAAHVVSSGGRPECRSMLVHPSRETDPQGTYATWIRRMKENWQGKIDHAQDVDPTNLRNELSEIWSGLRVTFPEIASFEDCWAALGLVFRNLDVTEVNTRAGQRTPVIDWVATKFYILVGGQAIDRGFTVEGLTVTYMPRGGGTLTADTIQQRARFFGYKRDYLGLCRVYLEPVVRDAFENYVHHERDMLESLRGIESGQDSLKDWKRRFLLDPSMRPTRASVIEIPTVRVTTSNRWITDRFPVRGDGSSLEVARDQVNERLADVVWNLDEFGNRVGYTTARTALELFESVLPQSLLAEANSRALSLALARIVDDEPDNPGVALYMIRPNEIGLRTETQDGSIQIFQGRGPNYPGDREIFAETSFLTVQFHQIRIEARDEPTNRGQFLVTAWRISESSSSGWLVQVGD